MSNPQTLQVDLSRARDMLAAAQTAYVNALAAKSVQRSTGGSSRQIQAQDIDVLLNQIQYWRGEIEKLEGRQAGRRLGPLTVQL